MSKIVRMVVALAAVALLTYVWLEVPGRQGYVVFLAVVLLGLVGGLLMGSWWSLVLVPVTMRAAGWLHGRIECPDCPSGEAQGPVGILILGGLFYGLAMLGAAVGTLGAKAAAKLVARVRHPYRPVSS